MTTIDIIPGAYSFLVKCEDRELGHIKRSSSRPEVFELPVEMLVPIWEKITDARDVSWRDDLLKRIWEFLPDDITEIDVEYESEYDDEGGYYWMAYGPHIEHPDVDEYEWSDLRCEMQYDWFPPGTYRRDGSSDAD